MQTAKQSTLISIFLNIVLTVTQVFIGIFAHSQGLIADGIHSFSDLLADLVVLLANHHSKKDADDDHQYGHYRYENAASFIIGFILMIVGVAMLWSAFQKISHPDKIQQVHWIALYVALIALLSKELLFRYMLKVALHLRSSLLVANAWHARSDAASSLVVAVGIIGNLWGHPLFDPLAALIIGLVIFRMGWKFAWSALHDLMDKAASSEEIQLLKKTLLGSKGVLGLHELRTRKVGDMLIVDVHLEVCETISVKEGHAIAVGARANVLKTHPHVLNVMTHVDPVIAPTVDKSANKQE